MDKSVEITPEAILASVREVFEEFKTNKQMQDSIRGAFKQMATGWVSVGALFGGA